MYKASLAVASLIVAVYNSLSDATSLASYRADNTKVSVSGVSSGAAMAVQLHVAYSSAIMGAGAVAGVPYYCAQGSVLRATVRECSARGDPSDVDIPHLKSQTETWASQGKVDATSHLASSRVYLFSGTEDAIVQSGLVNKLQDYYEEFITNAENIMTVYDKPAGHAFITNDYGNSCAHTGSPYINDCDYNMAYEILNHIYGNLQEPTDTTVANGQLLTITQNEFFPLYFPLYLPMDYYGHIYVPTGCATSGSNCKLHIALHGCSQTAFYTGDKFWKYTGYNEVAELNNIIILYPQAIGNSFLGNVFGCWDWWGYSGSNYANNQGWEMKAIKGMIDRVLA